MSCDVATTANSISTALLNGTNFVFPNIDINDPDFNIPDSSIGVFEPIADSDLTTATVNGSGVFDILMKSVSAHIMVEYKANRISGAEYTKLYAQVIESVLAGSISFLLQRNQAAIQAETLKVQLATAKMDAAARRIELSKTILDVENSKMAYAVNKIKLAEADAQYCSTKFNLEEMLPAQKELLDNQVLGSDLANSTADYNLQTLLPKQSSLLTSQIGNSNASTASILKQREVASEDLEIKRAQTLDTRSDGSPVAGVIGKEKANLDKQLEMNEEQKALLREQVEATRGQTTTTRRDGSPIAGIVGSEIQVKAKQVELVSEQVETQRANTKDTRTDGSPVTGSIGQQIELQAQQVISFQKDAQLKAARLFTEAWLTNKTVDEGLDTPPSFSVVQIEPVLQTIKTANELVP